LHVENEKNERGYTPETDYIELANEFAIVRLRKVVTRNGARLEVTSPKMGLKTYLDPLQLECLTWADYRTFSKLLETPWGPSE
jgi:hypothetical protein